MPTIAFSLLLIASVLAIPNIAAAAPPPATAVFDATFVNSSPAPESAAEAERLNRLTVSLRQALEKTGQYQIIDIAPLKDKLDAIKDIHDCNGCEVTLAKQAGAQRVVVAWVQKVSELIINISIRIEDVETGQTLKGGSVDIRGNTDQSWDRGLKYLLEEHVLGDR